LSLKIMKSPELFGSRLPEGCHSKWKPFLFKCKYTSLFNDKYLFYPNGTTFLKVYLVFIKTLFFLPFTNTNSTCIIYLTNMKY
jgi:hypothetical protein